MRSFRVFSICLLAAPLLPGCPTPVSCPAGYVMNADGRCVGGADTGVGPDGSLRDAGTGPDGCALLPFYLDMDGDGHGSAATSMYACTAPAGYVASSDDCNDACVSCHPGATEVCGNSVDDDCNGMPDDMCTCAAGAMQPCGASSMGACRLGTQTCTGGAWGACTGNVDPMAETCNGIDDDCDGTIDDGLPTMTYYPDADGDGFGAMSASPMMGCAVPAGSATSHDDCDDTNAMKHPGATEICNGADDDCDGMADEVGGAIMCAMGMATTCTTSCGTMGTGLCSATCAPPTGAACSPPAETCDGVDQDCDGFADNGLGVVGMAATVTTTTGNRSPHIVGLTSGFGVLYYPSAGGQLSWQTIDATGGSPSAVHNLGTDFVPSTLYDFDARFDGARVLAVSQSSGEFRLIGFDPATGGRTLPGTPGTQLILPRGTYTAYGRAQIVSASSTSATIYVELRNGTSQYILRRFVVNTSTATPTITDQDDVATDLDVTPAWDVVDTNDSEVLVYRTAADDIVLATVASTGAATLRGTVRTAAQAPNVDAVALGLHSTSMVTATNPLGIALAQRTPGGIQYMQLAAVVSPAVTRTVALSGSAGPDVYLGFEPRNLYVVAPPATAGVFFVVAMDDDPTVSAVGARLHAWEVLGDGSVAPRALTVPGEALAQRFDISVGASGTSLRVAEESDTGTIVTRQLGCR